MLNNLVGVLGTPTPPVTSSYESIVTANGTGSSGTITFNTIPSGYKHLQIRSIQRVASGNAYMKVQFNSDTGANYTYHQVFALGSGTGSTDGGTGQTGAAAITVAAGSLSANIYGVSIIDILDYGNNSKNKTIRVLDGMDANGSGQVILNSGLWINTAAITSITLQASASSFTTASQFALYGIKG